MVLASKQPTAEQVVVATVVQVRDMGYSGYPIRLFLRLLISG